MGLKKTFGIDESEEQSTPAATPANNIQLQIDELQKQLNQRQQMQQPQKKKQIFKPPPPVQQAKAPPMVQPNILENPAMSKDSRAILTKMNGKAPFMATANAYGKAIAESILVQSDATRMGRVNFEDEMKAKIEIKGGSYALIYKSNNIPARMVPFVWQLDQGTRRQWAVFTFNNFYGHKEPSQLKFWKRFWKILVLTPLDNGSGMVDDYGKGVLAKFDEKTQFQMALYARDNEMAEKIRVDNKNFISAALTLWMDLQAYTKPKLNMKLVLWLIVGAGIVVVAYYFLKTHPGFLPVIFGHL